MVPNRHEISGDVDPAKTEWELVDQLEKIYNGEK